MARNIEIVRKDSKTFRLTAKCKNNISVKFTTSGVVTPPTVGDIYSIGETLYILLAINSTIYTFLSSSGTAPATTGTLTKVTGSGQSPISYTAIATTDRIDITNTTAFLTSKENIDDADSKATISKTWTSHYSPATGNTYVEITGGTGGDSDKEPYSYVTDVQLKLPNNRIVSSKRFFIKIIPGATDRTS